jgi:HAD superfamily hydrolase (TIGR01509 family)
VIVVNELMSPDVFRGIAGVVFDCDGVLVDSYASNVWYYNAFRETFGLGPMDAAGERYVHCHNVYESLRHVIPEEHFPKAWEMRKGFDYRRLLPHLRLEPGLRRLLLRLRAAGIRLAVNTSRTTTMDMLLAHLALTDFFQPVVTASVVRHPKPHPEGMHAIGQAWGAPMREIVFVGDSRVDEATAQAAGARFWAYKDERLASAELFVPDFYALTAALARALCI